MVKQNTTIRQCLPLPLYLYQIITYKFFNQLYLHVQWLHSLLFDNIFNVFEFRYIKLAICDFWYLLLFHELTWRIFLKIMEINYLCSMLKVNKSKSTSVAFILNSVDILKIWCQNTIKFKSSILEARLR